MVTQYNNQSFFFETLSDVKTSELDYVNILIKCKRRVKVIEQITISFDGSIICATYQEKRQYTLVFSNQIDHNYES